jgi:two-component system phosphate regulon sensor histidine kinase PhoR
MVQRQGRFFWKIFGGNVLLLMAVVGACVLLIAGTFDAFYNEELTAHLRTVGEVLRKEYGDALRAGDAERLERAANELATERHGAVRITFIAADGSVFGDSQAEPGGMESHAQRVEVRQAMEHGFGESTRYSTTVAKEMKYVALRVGDADAPSGVVRVAMPVGSITARTKAARGLFWRIALLILLAAVVLALGLARMWSERIARLNSTALLLSQGDLTARAEERGTDEIAALARSLNRMREHQRVNLETIDRHRRSLEYLLAKLQEGVIAADAGGEVMLMNAAAAQLLGLPHSERGLDGGLARTAARTTNLPHEIATLLEPDRRRSAQGVVEREVTVERDGAILTLLARVSDVELPGAAAHEEAAGGRLLVLTDITELTRTIRMKTDFVANASHELRTPLTAIRAAVETLVSLAPGESEEARQPLLEVIDRHSERLNAIVGDLLDLSRIESGRKRYEATPLRVEDVFGGLRARFATRLAERRLEWRMSVGPGAEDVLANNELLALVLDNLVDNAIKFTDDGGWVEVSTTQANGRVRVSVADNGCGIAPQEQERVFERFYQVERARTGAKRGTGLGLAIVRHAVSAMEGTVELSSTPGQGTRIDVLLPSLGK